MALLGDSVTRSTAGPPTTAEIVERREGRVFWKARGSEDGIVTSGERPAAAGGVEERPSPGSN